MALVLSWIACFLLGILVSTMFHSELGQLLSNRRRLPTTASEKIVFPKTWTWTLYDQKTGVCKYCWIPRRGNPEGYFRLEEDNRTNAKAHEQTLIRKCDFAFSHMIWQNLTMPLTAMMKNPDPGLVNFAKNEIREQMPRFIEILAKGKDLAEAMFASIEKKLKTDDDFLNRVIATQMGNWKQRALAKYSPKSWKVNAVIEEYTKEKDKVYEQIEAFKQYFHNVHHGMPIQDIPTFKFVHYNTKNFGGSRAESPSTAAPQAEKIKQYMMKRRETLEDSWNAKKIARDNIKNQRKRFRHRKKKRDGKVEALNAEMAELKEEFSRIRKMLGEPLHKPSIRHIT